MKHLSLDRDDKHILLQYVMIQANIIDLSSKIDLITAFSTEYMQESPDGCLISETYLNLIACFLSLKQLDHNRLHEPGYHLARQNSSINDSYDEDK